MVTLTKKIRIDVLNVELVCDVDMSQTIDSRNQKTYFARDSFAMRDIVYDGDIAIGTELDWQQQRGKSSLDTLATLVERELDSMAYELQEKAMDVAIDQHCNR